MGTTVNTTNPKNPPTWVSSTYSASYNAGLSQLQADWYKANNADYKLGQDMQQGNANTSAVAQDVQDFATAAQNYHNDLQSLANIAAQDEATSPSTGNAEIADIADKTQGLLYALPYMESLSEKNPILNAAYQDAAVALTRPVTSEDGSLSFSPSTIPGVTVVTQTTGTGASGSSAVGSGSSPSLFEGAFEAGIFGGTGSVLTQLATAGVQQLGAALFSGISISLPSTVSTAVGWLSKQGATDLSNALPAGTSEADIENAIASVTSLVASTGTGVSARENALEQYAMTQLNGGNQVNAAVAAYSLEQVGEAAALASPSSAGATNAIADQNDLMNWAIQTGIGAGSSAILSLISNGRANTAAAAAFSYGVTAGTGAFQGASTRILSNLMQTLSSDAQSPSSSTYANYIVPALAGHPDAGATSVSSNSGSTTFDGVATAAILGAVRATGFKALTDTSVQNFVAAVAGSTASLVGSGSSYLFNQAAQAYSNIVSSLSSASSVQAGLDYVTKLLGGNSNPAHTLATLTNDGLAQITSGNVANLGADALGLAEAGISAENAGDFVTSGQINQALGYLTSKAQAAGGAVASAAQYMLQLRAAVASNIAYQTGESFITGFVGSAAGQIYANYQTQHAASSDVGGDTVEDYYNATLASGTLENSTFLNPIALSTTTYNPADGTLTYTDGSLNG